MDRDKYLLHQVHAAKLATDITAGGLSTVLMWHRRILPAMLIAHAPPVVASVLLMRTDLSGLRDSRRGRYVLAHMPPSAQAIRFLGQVLAWWSAYRRRPGGVVVGALIIIGGWSISPLLRGRGVD